MDSWDRLVWLADARSGFSRNSCSSSAALLHPQSWNIHRNDPPLALTYSAMFFKCSNGKQFTSHAGNLIFLLMAFMCWLRFLVNGGKICRKQNICVNAESALMALLETQCLLFAQPVRKYDTLPLFETSFLCSIEHTMPDRMSRFK